VNACGDRVDFRLRCLGSGEPEVLADRGVEEVRVGEAAADDATNVVAGEDA
jgi:hypothetical protein